MYGKNRHLSIRVYEVCVLTIFLNESQSMSNIAIVRIKVQRFPYQKYKILQGETLENK